MRPSSISLAVTMCFCTQHITFLKRIIGCSFVFDAAGSGEKIVVMLQGESIFYPIFSQLFPFDVRYISDAVLPLTYNSTLLCTNVPQQEGQQGLFLCLSYHVPVKEMPHLAQILQTHMMTPPSLQLSQEADTCN